ncbi:hypothetical protein LPJ72_001826 [Coemansia sp. Benny D160-2]|nr:hypothetical protein LPJ72_001826 [Coemansia sp. Benny D160-2]
MIMSVILLLTWLFVRKYSGVLSNAQSLETFGLLMGWGSGINYHLSRLPQLWHNHKRNSVEGLSLAMFTIIFAANGSYAASLISMLPVAGPGFLHRSASYIYGPVGSIFIDVFVLIQFISLRKVRTSPSSSGSALP